MEGGGDGRRGDGGDPDGAADEGDRSGPGGPDPGEADLQLQGGGGCAAGEGAGGARAAGEFLCVYYVVEAEEGVEWGAGPCESGYDTECAATAGGAGCGDAGVWASGVYGGDIGGQGFYHHTLASGCAQGAVARGKIRPP